MMTVSVAERVRGGDVHHEQRRTIEGASPDVVRVKLGRRPASWLRPFLRLATTGALSGGGAPVVAAGTATDAWYRLSAAGEDGRMRFVWHPHAPAPVFRSFAGALACEADGDAAVLVLTGDVEPAEGAPAGADAAVLATLVDLLATAFAQDGDAR
jgi:hypothetical protein